MGDMTQKENPLPGAAWSTGRGFERQGPMRCPLPVRDRRVGPVTLRATFMRTRRSALATMSRRRGDAAAGPLARLR